MQNGERKKLKGEGEQKKDFEHFLGVSPSQEIDLKMINEIDKREREREK